MPERNLVKENLDIPPVKVRNDRKFHGFCVFTKSKTSRLSVEFKVKKSEVVDLITATVDRRLIILCMLSRERERERDLFLFFVDVFF